MTSTEKLTEIERLLRLAGVSKVAREMLIEEIAEYGRLCRFMTPDEERKMTAGEHPHENAD